MNKIFIKYNFYYFIYNFSIFVIFLFFLNFYFFNKNGNILINFYKKEIIRLKNKNLILKNKNKEKINKIFFWKNFNFKREIYARNNLDLIKNNEYCIYI